MKWQGSSVNKGLNSNKRNMFPPIKSIVKFNRPDFGNVFHQSSQLLESTNLILVMWLKSFINMLQSIKHMILIRLMFSSFLSMQF